MTDRGKKLTLAALGVVAALGVAEAGLRLKTHGDFLPVMRFDVNTRAALEQGRFLPDRQLFWRLPPDGNPEFDARIRAVHPGRRTPPRGDRMRILVLGDSCSRLSLQSLPFSAQLEESLGADLVEVFNASVPGYTTHQGLAWLLSQLLDMQPDLVVVYLGWNDHWRTTGMTDRELAASLSVWRPRLLALLSRRPDPPPLRVPLPEFKENLAEIVRLVREAGGQTILLTAPYSFTPEAVARLRQLGYLSSGDDVATLRHAYQSAVREVAAATGARLYDTAPLFAQLNEPRWLLHRDGIHPSDLGHQVLALGLAHDITTHDLDDPHRFSDPLVVAARLLAAQGNSDAEKGR